LGLTFPSHTMCCNAPLRLSVLALDADQCNVVISNCRYFIELAGHFNEQKSKLKSASPFFHPGESSVLVHNTFCMSLSIVMLNLWHYISQFWKLKSQTVAVHCAHILLLACGQMDS